MNGYIWKWLEDTYLIYYTYIYLCLFSSLFLSYIVRSIFLFFLFTNKCKNVKRMNEKWNYFFHKNYYVYRVICSRLKSM